MDSGGRQRGRLVMLMRWAFIQGHDLGRLKSRWWRLSISPWHSLYVALSRFFCAVSLIVVVSSPYRLLRWQSPNRSLGQSQEKCRAPGVPGGPGPPAPGPVEVGYKSRAGPACLFTLNPNTPPEELVFTTTISPDMSFQPCGQQFLCTATQAGPPTAAVESWGRRSRPSIVDAGTASSSAGWWDWFWTTKHKWSVEITVELEFSKVVIFYFFFLDLEGDKRKHPSK